MRKLILLLSAVYFIALAVLAIAIYRASPGPGSQEILGIALGDYNSDGGIAYLSGRRLDCAAGGGAGALAAACTIEIAGQSLLIQAERNSPSDPQQFGGECMAFYNDQEWPCRITSRHVHVNWFATIDPALGLSPSELDELRRDYPFENLPQQAFISGIFLFSALTAVVAIAATAAALRQKVTNRLALILISVAVGIGAFAAIFVLAFNLTSGFWD